MSLLCRDVQTGLSSSLVIMPQATIVVVIFRFCAIYRNKLEAGLQDIHGGTVLDAQIIGFIAEEYYAKSLRPDFPSANVKA